MTATPKKQEAYMLTVSNVLSLLEKHNCNLGELSRLLGVHQSRLSAWIGQQDEGVQAAIRIYKYKAAGRSTDTAMLDRYPDSYDCRSRAPSANVQILDLPSQVEPLKK